MKLRVYEHVTATMTASEDPALYRQGQAMRDAVREDFQRAGHALSDLNPQAHLIIAPETGGVLERLVREVWPHGLNAHPDAIALCSDKPRLNAHWRQHGVPIPDDDGEPWVVKPVDGAGCEQTVVGGSLRPGLFRQRWVRGVHASVSFIVHEDRVIELPAGRQRIEVDARGGVSYHGGEWPLDDPMEERGRRAARKAIGCVTGLRGWVGVDVVLGDDGLDYAIEINPRLTMSYVGLRQLTRDNLAAALLDPEAPLRFSRGPVRFDA